MSTDITPYWPTLGTLLFALVTVKLIFRFEAPGIAFGKNSGHHSASNNKFLQEQASQGTRQVKPGFSFAGANFSSAIAVP